MLGTMRLSEALSVSSVKFGILVDQADLSRLCQALVWDLAMAQDTFDIFDWSMDCRASWHMQRSCINMKCRI